MTTYDLVRKKEKDMAEQMRRQFKDHKAQYRAHHAEDPFGSIERVVWKKPDTCIYQVNFVAAHGCIFVSGDLGHGTFRNGYKTPWELALADYHYLSTKLETVDNGDRQQAIHEFDTDLLIAQMKLWLKDKEVTKEIRDSVAEDWERNSYDQREWREFLYRNEYASDLTDLHEFGEYLHPRILGWLEGINLAYKQLHPEKPEKKA